ncbi:hypothetical protein JAAARDRAFT_683427 [Jaapia argillacea MUCL 33604]|uniref:DUF6697 domain-containing protein n=1 Tax=Jaapia argillacea MUCL 33604 TaxID=933084 RepID=A0A067QNV3_9AGAM|nr:hypothetical protein JAAARDRAFT_683427 [Jaapia argillacea MUCL 33604]
MSLMVDALVFVTVGTIVDLAWTELDYPAHRVAHVPPPNFRESKCVATCIGAYPGTVSDAPHAGNSVSTTPSATPDIDSSLVLPSAIQGHHSPQQAQSSSAHSVGGCGSPSPNPSNLDSPLDDAHVPPLVATMLASPASLWLHNTEANGSHYMISPTVSVLPRVNSPSLPSLVSGKLYSTPENPHLEAQNPVMLNVGTPPKRAPSLSRSETATLSGICSSSTSLSPRLASSPVISGPAVPKEISSSSFPSNTSGDHTGFNALSGDNLFDPVDSPVPLAESLSPGRSPASTLSDPPPILTFQSYSQGLKRRYSVIGDIEDDTAEPEPEPKRTKLAGFREAAANLVKKVVRRSRLAVAGRKVPMTTFSSASNDAVSKHQAVPGPHRSTAKYFATPQPVPDPFAPILQAANEVETPALVETSVTPPQGHFVWHAGGTPSRIIGDSLASNSVTDPLAPKAQTRVFSQTLRRLKFTRSAQGSIGLPHTSDEIGSARRDLHDCEWFPSAPGENGRILSAVPDALFTKGGFAVIQVETTNGEGLRTPISYGDYLSSSGQERLTRLEYGRLDGDLQRALAKEVLHSVGEEYAAIRTRIQKRSSFVERSRMIDATASFSKAPNRANTPEGTRALTVGDVLAAFSSGEERVFVVKMESKRFDSDFQDLLAREANN